MAAFVVLCGASAQPARADIDVTGSWGFLWKSGGTPMILCAVDLVQTGGAFTLTGTCDGSGSLSLAGTIDPVGGGMSATGSASFCAAMTLAGTAFPASDGFAGTVTCGPTFEFTAGKCGNAVLDAGESCDVATYDPSSGRLRIAACCSLSCTFEAPGTSCGFADACGAKVCDATGGCGWEYAPAGTACNDDLNVCTDDVCNGRGSCLHQPNTAPCGDGSFCSHDRCADGFCRKRCSPCCDADAGCKPIPAAGCQGPSKPTGPLKLRLDSAASPSQRVGWSWKRSDGGSVADFGDPVGSTDYAFCVYRPRSAGQAFDLLLAAEAPGGSGCVHGGTVTKPCWTPRGTSGFVYSNPAEEVTGDGIRKITLRANATGSARVQVAGAGARLRSQRYAGADPVVAQLRASNGRCWQAGYVDARRDLFGVALGVERVDYLATRSSPSGAFVEDGPRR